MSRKDLTSMKDENQDLQKQIGCISGFFQLFDRHRFFTGQRSSSNNQKIAIQGGASNHPKELNNNTTKVATEKNVKATRENQQFSTESSGTSNSSSSRSSSMSSLEFNRTIQIEPPPSINQIKTSENSNSGAAMKQHSNQGRHQQSLDFYDIVKDSMNRELHGLSVKTVAKEGKKVRILKRIDSPRPSEAPKSANTGVKLAWDSPRLSYDGRDIQDSFKYATKPKELPRLSLDSRERSIKSINEGTKSHTLLKDPPKGCVSSSTVLKQLQEPVICKRQSSVVAKLMGLDSFLDCTQTCDTPPGISSCTTNKSETFAGSNMVDEYKQHQSSASPRTSKGPTLLQSRRDASILNMMPDSQFSQEPTPWRQPEASQGTSLQGSMRSESPKNATNLPLSVYGEMEKRIADLEFKNSGKDLRALKQILDAMQRYKESLDVTRDQASSSTSDIRSNSSLSENSVVQSPRMPQKDPTSIAVKMSNSNQDANKSSIFIMKPANAARKTNNLASTETSSHRKSDPGKLGPGKPTNGMLVDQLNGQTAKGSSPAIRHVKNPINQPVHSVDKSNKMRNSKLMQSSKVSQVNAENATSSSNTAETRSPRLQKKFGLERRSPTTSPSSDSSSERRQHNRQSAELSSQSTAARQKLSTLPERNQHFSKLIYQRRDFKHEVDVISPDSDSKRSMDSYSDIEVIHIDHSEKNNSIFIQLQGQIQNNTAPESSKESFMAEKIITAEQPSPVSVLDAAFYKEEPPSPVKKKSYISKDLDEALDTYDSSEENSEDLTLSSNTAKASFCKGTSDIDFDTQNLVQMLQQIDDNDKRITNISDKDPDHKYISKILTASGLLSGPSSSQAFHSSSYPINPKLFLTLEQIKTNKMYFNIEHSAKKNARMLNPDQIQRKLMFDVINEILAQKLLLESSSTLWCQPNQLSGRKLRGQQLLEELCTEIDKLQYKNTNVSLINEDENLTSLVCEELMHCPIIDTNSYSALPNIVLDIERLVFKDLITEVVRGELANPSGKHCRKLLFPK